MGDNFKRSIDFHPSNAAVIACVLAAGEVSDRLNPRPPLEYIPAARAPRPVALPHHGFSDATAIIANRFGLQPEEMDEYRRLRGRMRFKPQEAADIIIRSRRS